MGEKAEIQTCMRPDVDSIIRSLGSKTTGFWSKMLKSLPSHELGVISLAGGITDKLHMPQLSAELAYLASIGFFIPVVANASIDVMSLCRSLRQLGVGSRHFAQGAIACSNSSIPALDTKQVIEASMSHSIPLVACGNSHGSTALASELARHLNGRKLIILGEQPITDMHGNVVNCINSLHHFDSMLSRGLIDDSTAARIRKAYEMLLSLGPGHSLQFAALKRNCSAGALLSTGLLEELLGNGTGTLIQYPPLIQSLPLEAVDTGELGVQINSAFLTLGKKLVPGYFKEISSRSPTIYMDSLSRGGAITYSFEGTEYMCKLFTKPDFEGMGIASSIIGTILLHKKKLAWRTALENAGNIEKYAKIIERYEGSSRQAGQYMVYMIGIEPRRQGALADAIASIGATLEKV